MCEIRYFASARFQRLLFFWGKDHPRPIELAPGNVFDPKIIVSPQVYLKGVYGSTSYTFIIYPGNPVYPNTAVGEGIFQPSDRQSCGKTKWEICSHH